MPGDICTRCSTTPARSRPR